MSSRPRVEVGAERFVQISTDKAVQPTSVMGASKSLAEQVVLAKSPKDAAYCAVRFGNVLGSRGSVIPTFARQIANGGPVTVTDPRMTRFFMSVAEAVQLVLQSAMLSRGGEIFMLDMGQPVRIMDLAQRMIRLSGYRVGVDIPIEITGIRPGEKLDEELCEPEEQVLSTSHPYINRLAPVPLPQEELSMRLARLQDAAGSPEWRRTFAPCCSMLSRLRSTMKPNSQRWKRPAAETTVVRPVPIRPVPLTQNGFPSVITAPA